MPGITLVCSLNAPLRADSPAVRAADTLPFDERYTAGVLYGGTHLHISCTRYAAYPVTCVETEDATVVLEGRLYGLPESRLPAVLAEVTQRVFGEKGADREWLRRWVLSTDGEYVLVFRHKGSGEFAVLNDHFGRLHLYAYRAAEFYAVSRDVRYFAELVPAPPFDRMGLAQFLLLGFPLGQRTLRAGVERLMPGTLVRGTPGQRVTAETLYVHNFEPKEHSARDLDENARILAELLVEACRRRNDRGQPHFISLSGGMDSRGIAAAYHAAGVACTSGTFVDHEGAFQPDLPIAEQLAQTLQLPWTARQIGPPVGRDLAAVLRAKQGLNALSFGFLLPFYRWVLETCGADVLYLTGDIGGHVVPDRRPSHALRNLADLLEYVVSHGALLDPQTVAALTGVPAAELLDELRSVLSGYPETDYGQKYVHYFVFERNYRWNAEGEDRNRYYFWHATPFAAPQFMQHALGTPDEQKADWKLYHALIGRLAPRVLELGLVNWRGATLNSRSGRLLHLRRKLIDTQPWLLGAARWVYRRRRGPPRPWSPVYRDCIQRHLRDWSAAECYLRRGPVEDLLAHSQRYSHAARANLLTAVALLEQGCCGRNTLAEFADAEFV